MRVWHALTCPQNRARLGSMGGACLELDAVGSAGRDARGAGVQLPRSPGANVVALSKEEPGTIERVVPPGPDGPVTACAAVRVWEREDRFEGSLWGAEGARIVGLSRSVRRVAKLMHASAGDFGHITYVKPLVSEKSYDHDLLLGGSGGERRRRKN